MVFQNECTNFLDKITSLRKATIEREVNKQLELKHLPYKAEIERIRDEVIARENAIAEREIQSIIEKRDFKIKGYREETAKAIELNRETLVETVTEKISKNYDAFILSVSNLVDETQIKD